MLCNLSIQKYWLTPIDKRLFCNYAVMWRDCSLIPVWQWLRFEPRNGKQIDPYKARFESWVWISEPMPLEEWDFATVFVCESIDKAKLSWTRWTRYSCHRHSSRQIQKHRKIGWLALFLIFLKGRARDDDCTLNLQKNPPMVNKRAFRRNPHVQIWHIFTKVLLQFEPLRVGGQSGSLEAPAACHKPVTYEAVPSIRECLRMLVHQCT